MRLRKVKNAENILESCNYVIFDYELHCGKFNELFKKACQNNNRTFYVFGRW